MALNRLCLQPLCHTRICRVLKQRPHIAEIAIFGNEENRFPHTQAELRSRAEMPLISAFRRTRNGISDELEAKTEVHIIRPYSPKSLTCQGI